MTAPLRVILDILRAWLELRGFELSPVDEAELETFLKHAIDAHSRGREE